MKSNMVIIFSLIFSLTSYASNQCASEFSTRDAILNELADLKVEIENLIHRAQTGDSMARSAALTLTSEFNLKLRSALASRLFTQIQFIDLLNKKRGAHQNTQSQTVENENRERESIGQSVNTYKIASTFLEHKGRYLNAAIFADGLSMIAGAGVKQLKFEIWSLDLNTRINTIGVPTEGARVQHLALTRDGKSLIVAGYDEKVFALDIITGKVTATFATPKHYSLIKGIALSGNGKTLIVAYADKTLVMWDVLTQTQLQTFEGHVQNIEGVAISSDGHLVISCDRSSMAYLWQLGSSSPTYISGGGGRIGSVGFSADDQKIITGDTNGLVLVLDARTKREVGRQQLSADILFVAFSPDGTKYVAADLEMRLHIYDINSGDEVFAETLPSNVKNVTFSRDSKVMHVFLWNGVSLVLDRVSL